MTRCALVVAAVLATGCTKKNPDFCESNADCPDGICDINGEHGPANTCTDATADGGAVDAPTGTPDAPPEDIDAGGGECASSSECANPGAPICDDTSGTCRACGAPSECSALDPAAPVCAPDGRCVECLAHTDCGSEVCDLEAEACVSSDEIIYVDVFGSPAAGCGTMINRCKTFTLAMAEVTVTRNIIKANAGLYNDEPASVPVDGVIVTLLGETGTVLVGGANDALTVSNGASLTLRGMTIQDSSGKSAIRCTTADTTVAVLSSTLKNNGSSAVKCEAAALTIEDSLLQGNGAGIDSSNAGSTVVLRRTRIEDNSGDGATLGGFAMIEQSTIAGNNGAGLAVALANLTVRRTMVARNLGGGLYIEDSDITVENSFVVGNGGAPWGGIVIFDNAPANSASITFTTIVDNTGPATYPASGLHCEGPGTFEVSNNIFYGNQPAAEVSTDCNATYSDVEGGATGEGNIDLPPMFVASDNYHIQSGSPCRNMADPAAPPGVDFDGDVRPEGGRSDMGADEFVP